MFTQLIIFIYEYTNTIVSSIDCMPIQFVEFEIQL